MSYICFTHMIESNILSFSLVSIYFFIFCLANDALFRTNSTVYQVSFNTRKFQNLAWLMEILQLNEEQFFPWFPGTFSGSYRGPHNSLVISGTLWPICLLNKLMLGTVFAPHVFFSRSLHFSIGDKVNQ